MGFQGVVIAFVISLVGCIFRIYNASNAFRLVEYGCLWMCLFSELEEVYLPAGLRDSPVAGADDD